VDAFQIEPPGKVLNLLDGLDSCRPLVELAAGYRAVCLEHGFTEGCAEEMAVDYHRSLLSRVFRPGP